MIEKGNRNWSTTHVGQFKNKVNNEILKINQEENMKQRTNSKGIQVSNTYIEGNSRTSIKIIDEIRNLR